MSGNILKREKISCVRCPARGGVVISDDICKGWSEGIELNAGCPYYLRDNGTQIECTYKPPIPKRVVHKDGEPRRRESPVIHDPKFAITANHIFSLQVHRGKEHGPEWESARVSL